MGKQYKTAIHEASHFVLHLLYQRDLASLNEKEDCITIVKSKGIAGYVKHDVFLAYDAKNLKYFMAGFAGEFIMSESDDSVKFLTGQINKETKSKHFDGSDTSKILDWLSFQKFESSDEEQSNLLHQYFLEAIEDLKRNWSIIEYVAGELMAHETLEGEKLVEVWNMAVSLLDLKEALE